MKLGELNKWLPVLGNIVELNASTKKDATVTIRIPDEMFNHLVKSWTGTNKDANYYVLTTMY